VETFNIWWSGLSRDQHIAISLAIAGPIFATILAIRIHPIRLYYIRTIEHLEAAERRIRAEAWKLGAHNVIIPPENIIKESGLSKWRIQRAMRWHERKRKYG